MAETGTSVGSGTVNVYAQTGDADCAATAGDEDRRPTSDLVDTHDLEFAAPTDFSFANHFTVDTPGSWRICGYVFQDEPGIDASPEALVTLSLRVKSLPLAPCKPGTHRVNSVCVKKKKKRKSTRK